MLRICSCDIFAAMRKILLFVCFLGLSVSFVWSQQNYPRLGHFADSATVASGNMVDIHVTVDSFQNITSLTGTIVWDTAIAELDTVFTPNLGSNWNWVWNWPGAVNGQLNFQHYNLITVGPNMNTGDTIYTMRFLAKGNPGSSTQVGWSSSPTTLFWNNGFGWSGSIDTIPGLITISGGGGCPTPTSAFSASSSGKIGTFTNTSSTTGAATYLWEFGDGNTSQIMNSMHIYPSYGTYTVCLTVTDSCGSDSSCQQLTLTCQDPVAAFTDSTGSNGEIFFIDNTTNSPTSWSWSFGDGSNSSTKNPAHTYTTNGTYEVCLIASNACGADTVCDSVTVMITAVSFMEEEELTIFPVPANEQFTIVLPPDIQSGQIFLTDVYGRMVKFFRIERSGEMVLQVGGLSAGKYFVEVYSDERSLMRAILLN